MRVFDVVVVGGGPAALAALSALGANGVSALSVRAPTPAPVLGGLWLGPSSMAETTAIGLDAAAVERLEYVTLHDQASAQTIAFHGEFGLIAAADWQRTLNARFDDMPVDRMSGRAVPESLTAGALTIRTADGVACVRSERVVWAVGAGHAETGTRRQREPEAGKLAHPEPASSLRFTISRAAGGQAATRFLSWEAHSRTFDSTGLVCHGRYFGSVSSFHERARSRDNAEPPVPLLSAGGGGDADRVLVAGDASGVANKLTGEGVAHAIRTGRLAGRAVVEGASRAEYASRLRREYGSEQPGTTAPEFQATQLAYRSIEDTVAHPSVARTRMAGLLLDFGVDTRPTPATPNISAEPDWPPSLRLPRHRIAATTARTALTLWRSTSASPLSIAGAPEIRLSDLLVACSLGAVTDEVVHTGAALDLAMSSIGLLAAGVSPGERRTRPEQVSWVELTSVVGHDVLAAEAMSHAMRSRRAAGAFLNWLGDLARLRSGILCGDVLPRALFETAFEFPCQAAGLISARPTTQTAALARIGRGLGLAFALGEETFYEVGAPGRLGLSGELASQSGFRLDLSAGPPARTLLANARFEFVNETNGLAFLPLTSRRLVIDLFDVCAGRYAETR